MTVNTVSVQQTKSQASSWLWILSQYSWQSHKLLHDCEYRLSTADESWPFHDCEYRLSTTEDPCLLMTMNTFSVQQGIHAFSWQWIPSQCCNRGSMPSHDYENLLCATECPCLLMTMNTLSVQQRVRSFSWLWIPFQGSFHFMIVNTFSVQQRDCTISWLWIPSQCNRGSVPFHDCEYLLSATKGPSRCLIVNTVPVLQTSS